MISSDPPGISFSNHSSTKRYLPLAGYADKLSARPGDSVAVKVSSLLEEPYHASLVQVRYADPNPEGPGVQTEEIRVEGECLLYTYPSQRDRTRSRMPSSA